MDQIRPLVIKFIYIAAISLIFLTFCSSHRYPCSPPWSWLQ